MAGGCDSVTIRTITRPEWESIRSLTFVCVEVSKDEKRTGESITTECIEDVTNLAENMASEILESLAAMPKVTVIGSRFATATAKEAEA